MYNNSKLFYNGTTYAWFIEHTSKYSTDFLEEYYLCWFMQRQNKNMQKDNDISQNLYIPRHVTSQDYQKHKYKNICLHFISEKYWYNVCFSSNHRR